MRRLTGQAARHTGRALHFVCTATLFATVLTASLIAVLAWRLSQGPLDVRWLANRLETAADTGGKARIAIGSAAIAWEGFRRGVDMPLDIRLANVAATDAAGLRIADIPRAEISLSPEALLLGRLRPRRIEVDGARFRVARAADGSLRVDLGVVSDADDTAPAEVGPETSPSGLESISAVLAELARPAGHGGGHSGQSLLADLTHLQVRNASLAVVDEKLGATWRVPSLNVQLDRLALGGVEGHGAARLALGDQHTVLTMDAVLAPCGAGTQLAANLGPVDPAALARSARALAPLAALAAPVSASLRADLGPQFGLKSVLLDTQIGAGEVRIGASTLHLTGARLLADATPETLTLRKFSFGLQPQENGAVSQVQVQGEGRRSASQFQASLTLDLDQLGFPDLAALWPESAARGARGWVTQNITAGTARDGHVEAQLQGPADLSDVVLTGVTGTVSADGLTVYWLKPVPPIERARAKLRILDPDTIEITADAGQQRGDGQRGGDPLVIHTGKMRITGINHPDQFATIDADLAGGIAETVALLRQPRLRLLDKHPLPGKDPGGKASAKLNMQLPLEDKVRIEDIGIRAQAKLTDAHLGDIVAGQDLDQGTLDLAVTTDGLKLSGNAQIGGIAAMLGVDMDFRAGPPSQVLQRITAAGRATARQMAAIGLDPGPTLTGAADIDATLTERRNGRGLLQANADLTGAELSASPIEWRKPPGVPARLTGQATLERDRFVALDNLALDGKDVAVRAQGDFEDGRLSALRFERFVLGRTQAQGSLRLPARGQRRPIEASFHGPVIDLSAATARRSQTGPPSHAEAAPGPSWTLDARFDRALMAADYAWLDVVARAENDGSQFTRLAVNGRTAPGQPFRLDIAPTPSGRSLSASAADAGALLAGLDLISTMRGGQLTVTAAFDDRRADHPLSGTAEITDFRVKDPHGLGKLLQAMTLYGLVQAASGPGLGFNKATAPFTLTDEALLLGESRAFNPSLGLTAKGRIDLKRSTADIEGTIVPAYFFNSLLGNIPILGRLFSPEDGGGLFAARYTVRGSLDDPAVSVNPLSALTPGFLRGLFGLF